jgi:hypothetical protein
MRARYGLVVLALLGLLSTVSASSTSAQQNAEQVVLDLNHGAMDAYNNMDINRAGSMLEEALGVAQQNGVPRPLLAQTNMNLAVVYVGGLGDNDGGVRYFADALCADPNVQLDPLTSTPDIQSVFQVAVARVQQQGCPKGPVNVAPGAAANMAPMQQQQQRQPVQQGPAAEPSMDDELPPGWAASDTSTGKAKDFRRAFLQIGFALGMPWITPGMPADREAPHDSVFIHARNGGRILDPQSYVDRGQSDVLRFPGAKLQDDTVPADMDFGIAQQNAWEPDQDSYDGYVNPTTNAPEPFTSSSCPGDGKDSGPPYNMGVERPFGLFPTSYCVRVNKPGFAPQMALRANLGYFVTHQTAIALIGRLQFSAGEGTLSNMLVGARVEYMFTKRKARGLMVSAFVGGTYGQIQAQPPAKNATGNEPWIKSGMAGAHIGTNIRYRFTDNLGIFMAPEFDLQFPTFLWNIDLTLLGGELSF